MKPKEFKSKYLHTLQTDDNTSQSYIKVPISDLNDLIYMQESLLEGLQLLSQLEERHYKGEQMGSIMYWLSKILLASYPSAELNGLSEWLASDP